MLREVKTAFGQTTGSLLASLPSLFTSSRPVLALVCFDFCWRFFWDLPYRVCAARRPRLSFRNCVEVMQPEERRLVPFLLLHFFGEPLDVVTHVFVFGSPECLEDLLLFLQERFDPPFEVHDSVEDFPAFDEFFKHAVVARLQFDQ